MIYESSKNHFNNIITLIFNEKEPTESDIKDYLTKSHPSIVDFTFEVQEANTYKGLQNDGVVTVFLR